MPVTRRLALEDTRHEETEPVPGRAQGEGLDLGRGDRKWAQKGKPPAQQN